jgi:predicted outer membrane repeat protein
MRMVLMILGIALFSSPCFTATIYVPDNYPTIQVAINASASGDTIVVRPGTYVENIFFPGKAIHVKSEAGPTATVIDGNQSGHVVSFRYGDISTTVLEGMTITNGRSSDGGGVYCSDSSPSIVHCVISGNVASDDGGGIYCSEAAPTLTNVSITGNTAAGAGGGIYCWFGDPRITNSRISGNTATWGGGIYLYHSLVRFTDCRLTGNAASREGGGIYARSFASPNLTNTVLAGNTATDDGGGIHCHADSSPMVLNSTLIGNSVTSPVGRGGGLWLENGLMATVKNSIFWHNDASEGPEIWMGTSWSPSKLTLSYSDVRGGQALCHVESGCTLNWGAGMIDADPLFADLARRDTHLTWNSPCRDSGDNTGALPSTDSEGDPRIAQGTIDMGADEFYPHLYHVGKIVPGSDVSIRVVGPPGARVWFARGLGVQDPPQQTKYGNLYLLQPLVNTWELNKIPADGVVKTVVTNPAHWVSGEEYVYQALIGPAGPYPAMLTNHVVAIVK